VSDISYRDEPQMCQNSLKVFYMTFNKYGDWVKLQGHIWQI